MRLSFLTIGTIVSYYEYMSSVDQEIDPQVAVGGLQRKGQHGITKYNAEKTKSYRNAVTALCVVRNIRQRLLLLVGGHSTSRRNKLIICFSLTTLLLLRLLHDHQYRYFFTNQTRGAARVVLDYSNVKNIQDLESLRKRLDSLCFPKMEHVCKCPDPLTPTDRMGRRHWEQAAHDNQARATTYDGNLDVVFYGDSITEGWLGTSLGLPNERKKKNQEVFKSLFNAHEGGGKYNALALGISGDLTTSLLWRLMNGELPESIHPRVFWVLIGTNDLGNTWCSPDATLLGILRVVEEIKRKRPGSLIVINSVLPRSWHQKGKVWEGKQKTKGSLLPQLWTSINDINHYLKLYCENQQDVIFFDANDIFFSNHFENPWQQDLTLDKNLMYDYLHPSYEGYKIWGDKIVQELDRLLG